MSASISTVVIILVHACTTVLVTYVHTQKHSRTRVTLIFIKTSSERTIPPDHDIRNFQ